MTHLTTQGKVGGQVKWSELAGCLKMIDWVVSIQLSPTKYFPSCTSWSSMVPMDFAESFPDLPRYNIYNSTKERGLLLKLEINFFIWFLKQILILWRVLARKFLFNSRLESYIVHAIITKNTRPMWNYTRIVGSYNSLEPFFRLQGHK